MVHFTSSDDESVIDKTVADKSSAAEPKLARVSYLPGVKPVSTLPSVPGEAPGPDAGSNGELQDKPTAEQRRENRANNVAIHQLARRGMSRWELAQVLERRGVEPELAVAELDRLESVGLLDDAALAVTLVFTQHVRKGLGRTAIAQELKRRHIDQETIDEALAEIADDDERERALELARKRVGQFRSLDDATANRRLSGYLARKGYSSSVIREAVTEAMSSRGHSVRFV